MAQWHKYVANSDNIAFDSHSGELIIGSGVSRGKAWR